MTDAFDYVVVGGGSGGCIAASELADDPGCRVLLLEAGPAAEDLCILKTSSAVIRRPFARIGGAGPQPLATQPPYLSRRAQSHVHRASPCQATNASALRDSR